MFTAAVERRSKWNRYSLISFPSSYEWSPTRLIWRPFKVERPPRVGTWCTRFATVARAAKRHSWLPGTAIHFFFNGYYFPPTCPPKRINRSILKTWKQTKTILYTFRIEQAAQYTVVSRREYYMTSVTSGNDHTESSAVETKHGLCYYNSTVKQIFITLIWKIYSLYARNSV